MKSRINIIFHKVIEHISPTLEKAGFMPPSTRSPRQLYGASDYIWRRELGWKNDDFRLSYGHGNRWLNFACIVNYYCKSDSIGELEEHGFASEGVGSIRLPTLLFVQYREYLIPIKALLLVEKKVSWYDKYSTPRKCLDELEKLKKERRDIDDRKAWYKLHTGYFNYAINIANGQKPGLFRGRKWGPVIEKGGKGRLEDRVDQILESLEKTPE